MGAAPGLAILAVEISLQEYRAPSVDSCFVRQFLRCRLAGRSKAWNSNGVHARSGGEGAKKGEAKAHVSEVAGLQYHNIPTHVHLCHPEQALGNYYEPAMGPQLPSGILYFPAGLRPIIGRAGLVRWLYVRSL